MALELPYGYKNLNPDGSSNVDESYGYYNSLAEAYAAIPLAMRKGGRTVGIKQGNGSIVEYWWENDNNLSDAGLVEKTSGGGGDFIPLAGTEVGKPLTGNIEVDTTNDRVGFYSEDNDRFVGFTDDGFNQLTASSSYGNSYLEQSPGYNQIYTDNTNSQYSNIQTIPARIILNSTDDEDDKGNSGELSIENYEFRFDSKTDNGAEFDGSLLYNAEDGLSVSNNPDDYININNTEGITASKEFDKQGDRKAFAQLSDLEDLELPADQVSYDNTDSGLDAETVQEAVDEVQGNVEQEATDRQLAIETAGFAQRTGTEIHFDKWATYGTYAVPITGNLSYSFSDMVKGMIQVMYHEDMSAPSVLQAGVTVIQSGDYVVENMNKITVHCIDENVIELNIKPL